MLHRYKIPFKKLPSYTFKKGHTPWNKGKKTGIRPPNLFKKGNVTWNTRELYSERIDRDGYTYIKLINKKKWKLKHRWIWEQKYGEIPADHVIIFADGNKKNFNIENLVLVSRKELAVLNKNNLIKNDIELTNIGVTIAKVKIAIAKKINKKQVKKMIKYKGTMEVIQDNSKRTVKFEINTEYLMTENELEEFERDFKNNFMRTHNGKIEILNFFIGVD